MDMISMKRSPEDKRKDQGEPASIEAIAPDYPYGLCLHLQTDDLDKLKMTTLPNVGDTMTFTIKVKVTKIEIESYGNETEREMSLQVTDMAKADSA